MKIYELIEELSKYPRDTEVYVEYATGYEFDMDLEDKVDIETIEEYIKYDPYPDKYKNFRGIVIH